MLKDPHRPVFHFSPNNWMNDPVPFFWQGEYHIFFQYNPHEPRWNQMHWGHIVSKDLVHWKELPIALMPTPHGADQDGCWTGSVIQDNDRFYILYTGVHPQVQCMASSADLISWAKVKNVPLNVTKPAGYGDCFRDPCLWKEKDEWCLLIGGEKADGTGGVGFLYRSQNLLDWTYSNILFEGDLDTGYDFECPDFFSLGNKYILLTSRYKTWWHLGQYRDHKFSRERYGAVDGGLLYAAKTLEDDWGRRILWGWIQEDRPRKKQLQAGWSGVLSLPRELKLDPNGSLRIHVVPELASLCSEHWQQENLKIKSGKTPVCHLIRWMANNSYELMIRFEPSTAQEYGLIVHCSRNLRSGKKITYNRELNTFDGIPLPRKGGEALMIRIFVDHSVIEAFANDVACVSLRSYPEDEACCGLALFCREGEVGIEKIDLWEVNPV